MSSAKFKIGGTAFATAGYDATAAQVVDLQLEASPASDITSCVYSVVQKTKGAAAPVFNPSNGVAATPTSVVTITMPASGFESYEVQCQTNGGAAVVGATGRLDDFSVNTKSRIIAVRGPVTGVRKIIPAESTEYSSSGWTDAQNEEAAALESGFVGGGPITATEIILTPAANGATIELVTMPSGAATTTDNSTPVALISWSTPTGFESLVELTIAAVVTTNEHFTQGAVICYRVLLCSKTVAGTAAAVVSIPGDGVIFACDETVGTDGPVGGFFDVTVSGPVSTLRIKGGSGETVKWRATATVTLSPLT